jgi:hypothetical protein
LSHIAICIHHVLSYLAPFWASWPTEFSRLTILPVGIHDDI